MTGDLGRFYYSVNGVRQSARVRIVSEHGAHVVLEVVEGVVYRQGASIWPGRRFTARRRNVVVDTAAAKAPYVD